MKILIPLLGLLMLSCQQPSVTKVITNDELVALLKNPEVQLVDVRTPGEWSDGIIPNAKKINYRDDNFLYQMEQALDKDKPLVVYCAAGGRSAGAAKKLSELGFKKIYDLGVGFTGWKAAGMPVSEE
ncbi:MAG: rhodanese-like domain-containing protein [Cytophagales bacterium]|nr:rhodanese-like domain-containing protein [Cytophagales bacterium]